MRVLGAPEGHPDVQIQYELTEADLAAVIQHFQRRSPIVKVSNTLIYYGAPAGLAGALIHHYWGWPKVATIAVVAAMILYLLFLFFVIPPFRKLVQRQFLRRLPGRRSTSNTLNADAEGLREVSSGIETKCLWAAICQVEEDAEHIFLWTNARGAFVVPKRAFGRTEDLVAFLSLARSHRGA
jgi:hypothetical protein